MPGVVPVIARARPDDAVSIAALWHAHLDETGTAVDASFTPAYGPEQTAARLKRALARGTLIGWVARLDAGAIAGYLTARLHTRDPLFGDSFRDEPVLYLVDVDVAQAWRRRGLARRLLAAAEDHAREQDVATLELAAIVRDTRAVAAWSRLGFVPRVTLMRRAVEPRVPSTR